MPPPRSQLQPRSTEQTSALRAAPGLAAAHGDTASLALTPRFSIPRVKRPRFAAKGESPRRTRQADALASHIVASSHNSLQVTRETSAQGMTATSKSPGAHLGRSSLCNALLASESNRGGTTRVVCTRLPARARSAEPCQYTSSLTADRAASLRFAPAWLAGKNGEATEVPCVTRCRARTPRPTSSLVDHQTRSRAEARPHSIETSSAIAEELQSRAVCGSSTCDISSSHTTSSPVLHPSGAASFAAAAPTPSQPGSVVVSAAPTREHGDDKGCASLPQSSSCTAAAGSATHRSTEEPALLERPWLARPPAHGILKRRGSMSSTVRVASISTSVAKSPASSCRLHTPSGSPKTDVADSNAGSLSNPESVGAHESARRTRHVTFDEASIGYLDTYGSHHVHEESRPRLPPENVVCGTAMLSSCAASDGGGCQPPAATAASVGKPNADSWGADSEWFNEVFGAQLTPVTATAHSATAVPTSSLAAAASEPPPLPSSTLIVGPSRVSLPSFSASLPSSSTVSELADTAARGTTRRLGTAGPNRGKYTISSYQSFGASAPITRSRTLQSTRIGMNAHLARDSAGAATPASNNMSVGEASQSTSDGGRYSSPVLAYRHAFCATSTRLGNTSVVAPSCSPSVILPPPPLSVRDLRRRSPATPPSLAAFAAVAGCSGADGPCGSSSHRRLSSPSVSFSNIQASLAEVTESGQGTESIKQEAPLVSPRTQTLTTDQRDDESPTLRAMKLSVGERRLLQAVMTVNVRKRRIVPEIVPFVDPRTNTSASPMSTTEIPNSKLSSDADGGLNSIPISTSSSTGRAVRALRETTRSMDDPHAKVLSRDVRQSIDVGAPLSSPTASLCSRVSHSAAVDVESSADSSVRTGVSSAQLSSRCSTIAPPTTVSATSGMNGNPRSTTVPSADSLSSALSSSLHPSPGQRLSAVRRSGSQTSWKDDTVTAAPSALLSETRRPRALTPRSHSHRGRMSASQVVHRQSDGCDRDEDESEPHIQVPVPTPRTSAGTSNWAAQSRRSGDRR